MNHGAQLLLTECCYKFIFYASYKTSVIIFRNWTSFLYASNLHLRILENKKIMVSSLGLSMSNSFLLITENCSQGILESMRRRARIMTDGFNSCRNVVCNFTEGLLL